MSERPDTPAADQLTHPAAGRSLGFQLLWHSVRVEAPPSAAGRLADHVVPLAATRWPMAPETEATYALHESAGGWHLAEAGDAFGTVAELEGAWGQLRARVAARALELAMRKGWTAFTGTVVRLTDSRIAIVGPSDERARAAETLRQLGGSTESNDGWIARGAEILPVSLRGSLDCGDPVIAPIDQLLLWRLGDFETPPASPEAIRLLLGHTDRSVQQPGELLRAVSALAAQRQSPSAVQHGTLGPQWYFF